NLLARFLKGEIQSALPALAGGTRKMRRQAALARARGPRDQNCAATKETAAPQHRVQPRHPAGDLLAGRGAVQSYRSDGKNGQSRLADQERILVVAVRRTTVFDHLHVPRGDLVRQ